MHRSIGPLLLAGLLVAGAATLAAVTPGAASADGNCSHEEALEMGSKLHEELDVSSERFRDRSLSKAEQEAYRDAFFDLMDASDLALRGEDAEACKRYREIAARMDIDLD